MSYLHQRQLLEELRSQLVGDLHTQPFTIYTDETIEDLLKAQPTSLEELSKVKGFPRDGKRIKQFGASIVAIFKGDGKSIPAPNVQTKPMDFFVDPPRGGSGKKLFTLAAVTTTVVAQLLSHNVEGSELSVARQQADLALAKANFVMEAKESARADWEVQQNLLISERLEAEDAKFAKYESMIEEAANKDTERKEKSLKAAKTVAEKSVTSALSTSKDVKEIAKKLRRKEVEKVKADMQQKAKEKEEDVSSTYVRYAISDEDGSSEVKSWMPHLAKDGTSIFSTSSEQYELQKSAETGEYGIRIVNGRYCIAVGSRFAYEIGTKIDVVLENGTILKCILSDQKADKDTDASNSYHLCDGSYVEFIVDRVKFNQAAKKSGNVGSIPKFAGKIAELRVYEEG